jgi:hypothetical protein
VADGKEPYYLNPAGAMMAAPISVAWGPTRTRRAGGARSDARLWQRRGPDLNDLRKRDDKKAEMGRASEFHRIFV